MLSSGEALLLGDAAVMPSLVRLEPENLRGSDVTVGSNPTPTASGQTMY
jgi:hypothetical protein